jgi:hypothetical protein
LGGECEFLGFPFGGAWRATFANNVAMWMPFVKHCAVSALVIEDPRIWILDGTNNVGFSGGPVIFGTGPQLKILGVISAYRTEPVDVIPSAPTSVQPNVQVKVNSGFFLAFDIRYAIEAIHKHSVGPLRKLHQYGVRYGRGGLDEADFASCG